MVVTKGALQYPFSDHVGLEMAPDYDALRSDDRLVRIQLPYGEQAWLATGYRHVRLVLGDARFSRAATFVHDEPRVGPQRSGLGMLAMDPPAHTTLRRTVSGAFSNRRIEPLRRRAQELTAELLDTGTERGPELELVGDLALPLSITMICELLGVPTGDRDRIFDWAEAFLTTTSLSPEQVGERARKMYAYMDELLDRRLAEPATDLLGLAGRAWQDDADSGLSREDIVWLGVGLLVAGYETTASQLANSVYALMHNRQLWMQLGRQPSIVPAAVEELLRYVPLQTTGAFPRYATEDVELGGVVVRAGEAVLPDIMSANRDERVFGCPAELNLQRERNQHVAFGHGIHHCLGAPLARVELQVALTELTGRFPDLELTVPEVDWKAGMLVRGPVALPVRWSQ